MERWPNFFIVGAPKAGTTSLYRYLNKIPQIYMSPYKEPTYFSPNYPRNVGLKVIQEKEEYLELFLNAKDAIVAGEASTSYLWDPETPQLIHEIVPHARIISILRDPVERAYSHYLMHVRNGLEKLSFHEAIEKNIQEHDPRSSSRYLEAGLYHLQIKRYVDIFSHNQVKILIFEEFIQNPKSALEEVLKFIGINFELKDFEGEVHNPFAIARGPVIQYIFGNIITRKIAKKLISPSRREFLREKILFKKLPKPRMNQEDKETLIKFYRDDVEKLQTLLGRKLPWPNF